MFPHYLGNNEEDHIEDDLFRYFRLSFFFGGTLQVEKNDIQRHIEIFGEIELKE